MQKKILKVLDPLKKIRRAEQKDVNIYHALCTSSIVQEWRK